MRNELVLDFETSDPYIGRNLGAGWVYGINVGGNDFKILGCSVQSNGGKIRYLRDMEELKSLVDSHDTLIAHHISYEIGCLMFLYGKENISKLFGKTYIDTEILAKLTDTRLRSYSLSYLSENWTGVYKKKDVLLEIGTEMYPYTKKELAEKRKAENAGEVHIRDLDQTKVWKWAITHLAEIDEYRPDIIEEYANGDVESCRALYDKLKSTAATKVAKLFNKLPLICCKYRVHGIRVDLDKAREVKDVLTKQIAETYNTLARIVDVEDVNISSNEQLSKLFDKEGIKYPRTGLGNPKIDKITLMNMDNDVSRLILEYRKLLKVKGDFIDKVLDLQEFTCPGATRYGRVYPELNILQAVTGRFSCNSPNIQQIPARDKVLGPLCRSIFLPEEGDKWYSLDYSNQEGRIQIHYANKLSCDGSDEFVLGFKADPYMDLHKKVADVAGISREEAKALNLGLSYGMGKKKLGDQLRISDERVVNSILTRYYNLVPYLKDLKNKCEVFMNKNKYIPSILGRKLRLDVSTDASRPDMYLYRALNKAVQGSALDQISAAMVAADEAGIPVLFCVHDELVMSGNQQQAEKLRDIMVNAVDLSIPMVVKDPVGADNWGLAK